MPEGEAGGPRALDGVTALVTGGSRGIGAAVARELARRGAKPYLLGRDGDALRRLAAELGGGAVVADVTDGAAVGAALCELHGELGGAPDLLVNAAGVFRLAPLAEMPADLFESHLAVNLRGAFLTIRGALPAMLERGSGHIVNIGSVAGRRALPGNGAYSASKFGLRGLHEVLLEEIRGSGVRATLIEPAAVDTSMWDPLDPDGTPGLPDRSQMLAPREVAEAVLFAVSRPGGTQIPLLPIERA